MDFSKSDSHSAIETLARQIFRDQVDDDYQRVNDTTEADYDRSLWTVLAEAGLLGAGVAENWGGSGCGFVEVSAILEAQGEVLAPLPLWTSIVAASAIENFASQQQGEQLLPPFVKGRAHFSMALLDSLRGQSSTTVCVDGGQLNGQCHDVPWAAGATILLPVCDGEQTSIYLLPSDVDGLVLHRELSSNREAHYHLLLEGVALDDSAFLGERGQGEEIIEWLLQRCYTALASIQLGVVEEALNRTAEYTSERKQFNRPIAAFQAVSHRAADGYIDREALRTCVWQAAWTLSEGLDATTDARTAKWWACEAGHRIGHTAQHLHGGIGSDLEYPIHRYFLWAKQLEFTLGGAQEQLANLGRQLAQQNHLGAKL